MRGGERCGGRRRGRERCGRRRGAGRGETWRERGRYGGKYLGWGERRAHQSRPPFPPTKTPHRLWFSGTESSDAYSPPPSCWQLLLLHLASNGASTRSPPVIALSASIPLHAATATSLPAAARHLNSTACLLYFAAARVSPPPPSRCPALPPLYCHPLAHGQVTGFTVELRLSAETSRLRIIIPDNAFSVKVIILFWLLVYDCRSWQKKEKLEGS